MHPPRWFLAVLLMLLIAICAGWPPAHAQTSAGTRGVALVIGNAVYADRTLSNPVNDATDMAATLREARFDVMLRTNLDESSMKEAIAAFEDRLRAQRGAVGVFYFAGHGVQSTRGRNYLLPVGRSYQRERDIELFAVPADAVLAGMEKAGNRLNLVVLDACRDAPLPTETRSSLSRGLARMDAPSGSVIAFATASGRTASDNPGRRNGLYTQHLLRAMRMPGLRLEDVFKWVGREVEAESQGQQSPEEFMKLRDPAPFCFFDGPGCGGRTDPSTAVSPSAPLATHSPPTAVAPAVMPKPMQKVTFAADVFMPKGQLTLSGSAVQKLDEFVGRTQNISLEVVIAVGHASADEGSSAATQRLSVVRAEAVKSYLSSRGIDKHRIYTEGKGATSPVSADHAQNRRVELEAVGTRAAP